MRKTILFTGVPSFQHVAQCIPVFLEQDQAQAARTIPETESETDQPPIHEVKDSFERPTDDDDEDHRPPTRTVKVPLRPPHEPPGLDTSPLPTLSYLSWRRLPAPTSDEPAPVAVANSFMDHVHVPQTPLGSMSMPMPGLHGLDNDDDQATQDVSFLTVTPSQDVAAMPAHASDDDDEHTSEDSSTDLDRSFALHDDPSRAQITPLKDTDHLLDAHSTDQAQTLGKRRRRTRNQSPNPPPPAKRARQPPTAALQDVRSVRLADLPQASQLYQWKGQTASVNLVVGLVSKGAVRQVTTRRGATVELLELLVGDDTRAAFSVACWLDRAASASAHSLRAPLAALQPGDVLLLRSVALATFRNQVHAQSLGRGLHRTSVALLWRRGVRAASLRPPHDQSAPAPAPAYDSDTLARAEQRQTPNSSAPRRRQRHRQTQDQAQAQAQAQAQDQTLPGRARAVRAWVSTVIPPPPPPPPLLKTGGVRATSSVRKSSRTAVASEERRLPDDDTPGRAERDLQVQTTRRASLRARK